MLREKREKKRKGHGQKVESSTATHRFEEGSQEPDLEKHHDHGQDDRDDEREDEKDEENIIIAFL